MQPAGRRRQILIVCKSEVILHGIRGLLTSAGYGVEGLADPSVACRLLASRPFDLAIIGVTDREAHELLLAALAGCIPPVPVLAIDGGMRTRWKSGEASLLNTVARLVGEPEPTDGSAGPSAA